MDNFFEQFASLSDAIEMAVEAKLRSMFMGLPAILSQDGDGHTATATSAILGLVRHDDGTMQQTQMPKFDTVPVHFAGGGQVVSTHPHKAGDEGLLVFLARAIDAWHQNGGEQAPIDSRTHALSDSVFLGGLRSDPNKLANVSNEAIHHRSKDGKVTRETHPTAGTTDKVVDPSDGSSDPFNSATKYHSTQHSPTAGIVHTAADGTNLHTETLLAAIGKALSVTNGSQTHTISVHPTNGIGIASSVKVSLSAPPGQLGLPAGGVGGSALAAGAASSNVGALGGDLSGALPNPQVVNISHARAGLPGYANNAAAIAAGLTAGALYVNLSIAAGEDVICVAH